MGPSAVLSAGLVEMKHHRSSWRKEIPNSMPSVRSGPNVKRSDVRSHGESGVVCVRKSSRRGIAMEGGNVVGPLMEQCSRENDAETKFGAELKSRTKQGRVDNRRSGNFVMKLE